MKIGQRIKQRRKFLKMSADDLAKRLGKDRSTVYRYENGDIEKLPLDILKPIAAALDTSPQYLMGWDDEPEDLGALAAKVLVDPDLLKLVQTYLKLSESDQYALRLMAESLVAKEQKKTDAETSAEDSVVEIE
ncbi:MAG: helix-turn-helix transcriptional regulator [Clostridia bacterium]|nr:helix-turn-helix transcriptional regulator [Clostridia bacterium]